jgi:hypothetical protein
MSQFTPDSVAQLIYKKLSTTQEQWPSCLNGSYMVYAYY